MDSYIVALDDMSAEVHFLSRRLRLTHIFPFISRAVFEGSADDLGGYAATAVRVTSVSAALYRAKAAVQCPDYPI